MKDPLVEDEVRLAALEPWMLARFREGRNSWEVRQTTREFRLLTDEHQEEFRGLVQRPGRIL